MENEKCDDTQKALFVIDIQEDYTGDLAKPPFPYKGASNLIAKVNKIIEEASKKNIIVVYIKQEFDGVIEKLFSKLFCNGTAIKGNQGTEIDKRINIISNNIFSKRFSDAFSNSNLDEFLNKNRVDTIYLVGIDAQYCVYATAKGALKHGYNVAIIKDGIALRAERKWNEIIEKYERDGIKIISSEEF